MTSDGRHRVVVLALPPVIGFDLVIPSQILGGATDDDGVPLYDVVITSLDGASVPTSSGYSIAPAADASALRTADTVIVPGTQLSSARHRGVLDDDVRDALATIRPRTRMVSICTGAFVLAAAGVFDGRRATTHWHKADDFRRLFPRVLLEEDVLFVDEGDVLSSAGLSAGVDLCLHLLRTDHGARVANRVARYCVVPPWRDGGQAQFIDRPVATTGEGSTSTAREWALRNLEHDLDVPTLARRAGMSVRTFTRRFGEETAVSPGAWLTEQRLRRAQELLESTDLSVDQVADRSGLGSGASLRQHLRARMGVSPSAYRRTFRGV